MARKGDLEARLLEVLGKPGTGGMNKSELARELGLSSQQRADLRATLNELLEAGKVVRGKKSRYRVREDRKGSSGAKGQLVGTVHFRAGGRAVFFADQLDEGNIASGLDMDRHRRIVVPAGKTGVALDGDRVALKLLPASPQRGRGRKRGGKPDDRPGAQDTPVGRVEKVIERRSGVIVGTLIKSKKFTYVQPRDESLPPTIELEGESKAKPGQIVSVELTEWRRRAETPRGRVVKVLGWPDQAGVDIDAIVAQHALRTKFPPSVMKETRAVPDEVPEEEVTRREDWRKRDVITIDPVDAKDFDDAVAVRKLKDGWELAVHIADVSHYVKPDSALDKEAVERGNSTYLVDRVLPMLPPALSNGICSLRPGEDRLTCLALMRFDEIGRPGRVRFSKAVIHSKARLTYEEAQEMLEGKGGGKVGNLVRRAWELADILRKRRFRQGALDMEFAEVRVLLDKQGVPTGYKREEYNESHQLIEEFMLAANEAVARVLKNRHQPAIYRVHEDPDDDKLFAFAELARSHGYEPGDLTNRKHIQKLLKQAKGSMEEHAIKIGLLKSLKRAAYRSEPLGHYGLAKTDYAHFTSPIRRYADLVVHRALEPLLTNPPDEFDRVPDKAHCEEISGHISETERVSASAEDESRRLKMLEYLQLCAEHDEPPVFEGVVTEVRPMGLMVEATEILQKGLVKRGGFPKGSWRLEAHREAYVAGKRELKLGQAVKLEVHAVDLERQFVDFRIVG